MEGILLTAEEVADVLRLTPEDVIELVRDSTLAGFQVRGQWRITQESVNDLLFKNLRAQNFRGLDKKLADPESWMKVLEQFPDVKRRIAHENFERDSFGAFLKKALAQTKTIKNSSNVLLFRKPQDKPGEDS